MPIPIACACGHAFEARDDIAGQRLRCPGCGAPIDVPDPEAPDRVCPACSSPNPPAQEACLQCGRSFAAQEPPAPKRRRPFETQPPFALMALGMVYRPAHVLEYFRGWMQRPAVLVQLAILYVASLAAQGAVAAAGYTGPRPRDAPPAEPASPFRPAEDERTLLWKPLADKRGIEIRASPEHPRAEEPMRVRAGVFRDGQPAGVRLTATLKREPLESWGDARPVGRAVPRGPVPLAADPVPGWSVWESVPDGPGLYLFEFRGEPAMEGQPFGAAVTVLPARPKAPEERAVAPRVISAGTRILFTLLVSLVALAFNAFVINLASRIFGEGGEFLFMLIVLAFVQSIVNVGQLALFAIAPLLGPELWILLPVAFGLWEFALVLLAIMKVYEFDLGPALLTSAVASVIKMWVVVLIVGALLGM